MILYCFFCIIGFVLLYYGAQWLVKGSSSLARKLNISAVIIGLTVVAFGTSAPELFVSVISSVKGKSMIAVGNVIGSNICNIALILGVSAMFQPIVSQRSVVTRDIPIMLGICLYFFAISFNSEISRFEGIILFTGIIIYTFYYYTARKKDKEKETELDDIGYVNSWFKQVFLILAGIAGVVAGAQLVVDSAVNIMQTLGVSEKFVGLTIVAFGTSIPELATSVVAALKKEMDISIGNLVGSNVFNILSVLGAASIVRPIPVPGGFLKSGLVIDYIVMLLVSILPLIMMRKSFTLTRLNGFILLCCYGGYIGYLIANG